MTKKPKSETVKLSNPIVHPGMMGDGTEEQNLNEKGDPSLRVTEKDVVAAFDKPPPQKRKP